MIPHRHGDTASRRLVRALLPGALTRNKPQPETRTAPPPPSPPGPVRAGASISENAARAMRVTGLLTRRVEC